MHNPIIITGGTQRLGLAIAESLHKNGHEVVVTYRKVKACHEDLANKGIELVQVLSSISSSGTQDYAALFTMLLTGRRKVATATHLSFLCA